MILMVYILTLIGTIALIFFSVDWTIELYKWQSRIHIGKKLEGKAANGFIHLINSGSCTLDGTGCQTRDNKPVMKPFWEITEEEVEACLSVTKWHPASREYMRGGGYSSQFLTRGEMPVTMCRLKLVKGRCPELIR